MSKSLTPVQFAMLAKFRNGAAYRFTHTPGTDDVVHFLLDSRLIVSREDIAENYFVATQEGQRALYENAQRSKQEAENKAQQHFQNQISVLQVLVPLITFILGCIIEYRFALVSSLLKLAQLFR